MSDYAAFSDLLRYDPDTGKLFWKESRGVVAKGDEAGRLHHKGYVQVGVNGRRYLAHRVAWLLTHGEWPEGQIDHINGVRDDNRISNLRVVTHRGNQQNRKEHRHNRLVGATFICGRWQSQIQIDGKRIYIGLFDTEQEAHEAYIAALPRRER
jgi:hypothetical protein